MNVMYNVFCVVYDRGIRMKEEIYFYVVNLNNL